jgi:hypothetical protein
MGRTIKNWTPSQRAMAGAPSAPSAPRVSGPSTPNANQYTAPAGMGSKFNSGQQTKKPGMQDSGGYAPGGTGNNSIGKARFDGKGPASRFDNNKPTQQSPGSAPPAAPKYQPPPDPRDSTYYANTAALTNMLGQNTGNALLEQTLADNSFAENDQRMVTDRERARRNLAESLLGTGGIRSGSHRRDQTERDQDSMTDRNRLLYDYGNDKSRRNLEIAGYYTDFNETMLTEYLSAQDRDAAKALDQAATGTGNSARTPQQRFKGETRRLTILRDRLPKAKNDKQAARIKEQIKASRKRRATLAKKIRNG